MHTHFSLTTPYPSASLWLFQQHKHFILLLFLHFYILSMLFLFLTHFLHYGCNITHHQCLYFDEEILIRSVSQVCDLSYFGILQVLKNSFFAL